MLDLVRLARRPAFPPGGVELYRQIGLLTGMQEGWDVGVIACGLGLTVEYFAREWGVEAHGVDEDPRVIEEAEERVRAAGLLARAHFQQAPVDALPFRDGIFDVTIAELGLTARAEPEAAVRELTRVTRPGGQVVLVQPVWKAPVEAARRAVLSEHLGTRPLMLVEWKRLLREAGLTDLHVEDWTDDETAFRPHVSKPFPDFAELFSLRQKLGILVRAYRVWGWRGVWTAVQREREVHRLLTRERILGLDLIKAVRPLAVGEAGGEPATRAAGAFDERTPGGGEPVGGVAGTLPPAASAGGASTDEEEEVSGLPLFGSGES